MDTRETYFTELMLDALSLTGDRDAALARFVPGSDDGAMSRDGRR